MTRRLPLTLSLVAAVSLAGLAAFYMVNRQAIAQETTAAEAVAPESDGQVVEMFLGDEDAPVTLVEYASFTCPHCASFHDTVFPDLKAEYIDTGKVKFVFREVYFDRLGLWAGMLARCGGPEKYFGITDLLFSKQSEWAKGETAADITRNLYNIGRVAGLQDAQMQACLQNNDHAEALVATYQANVEADGVDSTPSLVIDGVNHRNQSYGDLRQILDAELAK